MAPLLSLSQLQAMRSLGVPARSNSLRQEQSCPKSKVLTLSAVGCRSLELLIVKINAAKSDPSIITLNLEQVIGRGHCPMFERVEDLILFEELVNLLQCDNRRWHRMKFVDTIQAHEFDDWREQKETMLYHVESIAENRNISVRMRLLVKIPCDTKSSIVISFLKAVLADKTIKTLMISGAMKFGDPAGVWRRLEEMFCHPEVWKQQERTESDVVGFHIFYDGADKARDTREEETRRWSAGIKHCIHALERSVKKKKGTSRRQRGAASSTRASSSHHEIEINPRHMTGTEQLRRRRCKRKPSTGGPARSSLRLHSAPEQHTLRSWNVGH